MRDEGLPVHQALGNRKKKQNVADNLSPLRTYSKFKMATYLVRVGRSESRILYKGGIF